MKELVLGRNSEVLLAASLAHEIKQPIAAAITSANAALPWLKRDQPNVERACEATTRIIKDGTRAAAIIDGLQSLYKKTLPKRASAAEEGALNRLRKLRDVAATLPFNVRVLWVQV